MKNSDGEGSAGETLSGRLDFVFGRLSNDEVADRLKRAGLAVSKETVRRYRGGSAERIQVDFVAAVATEFGVSVEWLLTGRGPMRPSGGAEGGHSDGAADHTPDATDPIRELRRRMDAIDARTDLTPAQREIAKDIELQMHRQGVLEYEARIADRRMRAMERVFDLAAGRPTTAGQGVPVEVTLEAFENTVRAGVRAEFEEEARRRAANRE